MNVDDLQDRLRRIDAAPIADRDELLRQLVRDVNSIPALKDKFQSWKQRGWALWGPLEKALKSALERNDISEDEKTGARREALEVAAAIKVFSQAPSGLVPRQMAFDLAMNALFVGLRAGMTPDELRKLQKERAKDAGKRSGEKRRASRRWVAHATRLAHEYRKRNPGFSHEDIATEIIAGWKEKKIDPPSHRQMVRHVSDLVKAGELPPRTGSRQT